MSESDLRLLLVEHWVEIAEEDHWAARMALEATPPKLSIVGFTTQQMAEKYLKAFLELHSAEIPLTHNLRALITRCVEIEPTFVELADDAAALDEVGITPRYPPVRLAMEKARQGLERAEKIAGFVSKLLPASAIPPDAQ
ncbi:MAG: HEPN domain-containing protein [Armatimonadetes bacterium]|nr:HEPN domain-containing protein [Armatimonadota bacterium]